MNPPTVPIGANGLEGWTSCCDAGVTFSGDGALCCKRCWNEVQAVEPAPAARRELGEIIEAVIKGVLTSTEGVARQHALMIEDATPTVHEGIVLDLSNHAGG